MLTSHGQPPLGSPRSFYGSSQAASAAENNILFAPINTSTISNDNGRSSQSPMGLRGGSQSVPNPRRSTSMSAGATPSLPSPRYPQHHYHGTDSDDNDEAPALGMGQLVPPLNRRLSGNSPSSPSSPNARAVGISKGVGTGFPSPQQLPPPSSTAAITPARLPIRDEAERVYQRDEEAEYLPASPKSRGPSTVVVSDASPSSPYHEEGMRSPSGYGGHAGLFPRKSSSQLRQGGGQSPHSPVANASAPPAATPNVATRLSLRRSPSQSQGRGSAEEGLTRQASMGRPQQSEEAVVVPPPNLRNQYDALSSKLATELPERHAHSTRYLQRKEEELASVQAAARRYAVGQAAAEERDGKVIDNRLRVLDELQSDNDRLQHVVDALEDEITAAEQYEAGERDRFEATTTAIEEELACVTEMAEYGDSADGSAVREWEADGYAKELPTLMTEIIRATRQLERHAAALGAEGEGKTEATKAVHRRLSQEMAQLESRRGELVSRYMHLSKKGRSSSSGGDPTEGLEGEGPHDDTADGFRAPRGAGMRPAVAPETEVGRRSSGSISAPYSRPSTTASNPPAKAATQHTARANHHLPAQNEGFVAVNDKAKARGWRAFFIPLEGEADMGNSASPFGESVMSESVATKSSPNTHEVGGGRYTNRTHRNTNAGRYDTADDNVDRASFNQKNRVIGADRYDDPTRAILGSAEAAEEAAYRGELNRQREVMGQGSTGLDAPLSADAYSGDEHDGATLYHWDVADGEEGTQWDQTQRPASGTTAGKVGGRPFASPNTAVTSSAGGHGLSASGDAVFTTNKVSSRSASVSASVRSSVALLNLAGTNISAMPGQRSRRRFIDPLSASPNKPAWVEENSDDEAEAQRRREHQRQLQLAATAEREGVVRGKSKAHDASTASATAGGIKPPSITSTYRQYYKDHSVPRGVVGGDVSDVFVHPQREGSARQPRSASVDPAGNGGSVYRTRSAVSVQSTRGVRGIVVAAPPYADPAELERINDGSGSPITSTYRKYYADHTAAMSPHGTIPKVIANPHIPISNGITNATDRDTFVTYQRGGAVLTTSSGGASEQQPKRSTSSRRRYDWHDKTDGKAVSDALYPSEHPADAEDGVVGGQPVAGGRRPSASSTAMLDVGLTSPAPAVHQGFRSTSSSRRFMRF